MNRAESARKQRSSNVTLELWVLIVVLASGAFNLDVARILESLWTQGQLCHLRSVAVTGGPKYGNRMLNNWIYINSVPVTTSWCDGADRARDCWKVTVG